MEFANKIKYPIIPLPEIDKLVKGSFLALYSDNSGYESESTIKGELLAPSSNKHIVRRPSRAEIIVNNKIEEAKTRLSFWSVCVAWRVLVAKHTKKRSEATTQLLFKVSTHLCAIQPYPSARFWLTLMAWLSLATLSPVE